MSYRLEYLPRATKAISDLPIQFQHRILTRLEALKLDPRPVGGIKLSGEDAYRIRVGDYRIIYTIEDQKLVVVVVEVGHRRDVYRRR